MTTIVSILLSDIIPLKDRGIWQGYINIVYASGASAGAALGGILADSIGWRWSFLLQAPMCLLAFITVAIALVLPKREHTDWKAKLRRIDYLGAGLLIIAVFGLLFGLDRGSNVAWRDVYTITSLAVAVPLFGIFLLVEVKIASEPFAPSHVVFERSLLACFLCNYFRYGMAGVETIK